MGKTKKLEKIFLVAKSKRGNKGLQIGRGFRGYKSGQETLQRGSALGISNWGKNITN